MVVNFDHYTDFELSCKKKSILVRGVKREVKFGEITLIFYLCEHLDCKHKASCVYLFPDNIYHCHKCEEYSTVAPLYKLKPKGRVCNECGEVVIDIIPPNWRLQGLKK